MPSVALSIDPGFANTGTVVWAYSKRLSDWEPVAVDLMVTKPDPKKKHLYKSEQDCLRIKAIVTHLSGLINLHQPSLLIAEMPHGGSKSAIAAKGMAYAKAFTQTVAAMYDLPLLIVTPDDIKRLVKERGTVSKKEVESFIDSRFPRVRQLYQYAPSKFEHVADAAGAFEVVRDLPELRMLGLASKKGRKKPERIGIKRTI